MYPREEKSWARDERQTFLLARDGGREGGGKFRASRRSTSCFALLCFSLSPAAGKSIALPVLPSLLPRSGTMHPHTHRRGVEGGKKKKKKKKKRKKKKKTKKKSLSFFVLKKSPSFSSDGMEKRALNGKGEEARGGGDGKRAINCCRHRFRSTGR